MNRTLEGKTHWSLEETRRNSKELEETRRKNSLENLQIIHDEGEDEFLTRFMTTDATWLSFITPNIEEGPKQRLAKGGTASVKANTGPVVSKQKELMNYL